LDLSVSEVNTNVQDMLNKAFIENADNDPKNQKLREAIVNKMNTVYVTLDFAGKKFKSLIFNMFNNINIFPILVVVYNDLSDSSGHWNQFQAWVYHYHGKCGGIQFALRPQGRPSK